MDTATTIIDEHRIRETAYHLWEQDGRPIGQDHRHWEMAKRIAEDARLLSRKPAAGAAPRKKRAAAKTSAKVQ
jgi:Protein of unknown function (DUF2934)